MRQAGAVGAKNGQELISVLNSKEMLIWISQKKISQPKDCAQI